MRALGFNIKKGELHFAVLEGPKAAPAYVDHGRHRFDVTRPWPDLADFFKQTFNEIIAAAAPEKVAYRLSINADSIDGVGYLVLPFGVLNLIAFERHLPAQPYTTQAFTKKALGYDGDKLEACDSIIGGRPERWNEHAKLAALSAWMCLS